MTKRTGRCLCGAVRFEVETENENVSLCHCAMCRRWTGGPFAAVGVPGDVAFEGAENIGTYRASEWGERGFCKTCGSTLFWRMQDGGFTALPAGAFDDQSGFRLVKEIFVDEQPAFYAFAQKVKRMTGPEAIAAFQADEG